MHGPTWKSRVPEDTRSTPSQGVVSYAVFARLECTRRPSLGSGYSADRPRSLLTAATPPNSRSEFYNRRPPLSTYSRLLHIRRWSPRKLSNSSLLDHLSQPCINYQLPSTTAPTTDKLRIPCVGTRLIEWRKMFSNSHRYQSSLAIYSMNPPCAERLEKHRCFHARSESTSYAPAVTQSSLPIHPDNGIPSNSIISQRFPDTLCTAHEY